MKQAPIWRRTFASDIKVRIFTNDIIVFTNCLLEHQPIVYIPSVIPFWWTQSEFYTGMQGKGSWVQSYRVLIDHEYHVCGLWSCSMHIAIVSSPDPPVREKREGLGTRLAHDSAFLHTIMHCSVYQDTRAACYRNICNQPHNVTSGARKRRQYCWPHGIYHAHSCRSIELYAPGKYKNED